MNLPKKRVVVVGLGKSGEAAAALLATQGAKVQVVDDDAKKEVPPSLRSLVSDFPLTFQFGPWKRETLFSAELIVISPGVPLSQIPLTELSARQIPLIGEIELAFRFLTAPLIAITGTNGKSTTATLVAEILKESAFKVFLGGNIGIPLSDAALKPFDFIVAEISSFQLETIQTFRPKIAALLNVTEDHLNRHKDFDTYRAIKWRIFENQRRVDYAVLNADDPLSHSSSLRGTPVWFGRQGPLLPLPTPGGAPRRGVFLAGKTMLSNQMGFPNPIMGIDTIKLSGAHNMENLLAATAISLLAGASPQAIVATLTRFSGLPHRMEHVREIRGVQYINDSKGTNVGAVLKSLEGMNQPVILIAGGLDKGADFTPLRESVQRKVKRLILLGDALPRMAKCFSDCTAIERVYSMKEAVLMAASSASPGDLVLLSPACASFDMFENYQHRGESFRQAVLELCESERTAQDAGGA